MVNSFLTIVILNVLMRIQAESSSGSNVVNETMINSTLLETQEQEMDHPLKQTQRHEMSLPLQQIQQQEMNLPLQQIQQQEMNLPLQQIQQEINLSLKQKQQEMNLPLQKQQEEMNLPLQQTQQAEMNLPLQQTQQAKIYRPLQQTHQQETNLPFRQSPEEEMNLNYQETVHNSSSIDEDDESEDSVQFSSNGTNFDIDPMIDEKDEPLLSSKDTGGYENESLPNKDIGGNNIVQFLGNPSHVHTETKKNSEIIEPKVKLSNTQTIPNLMKSAISKNKTGRSSNKYTVKQEGMKLQRNTLSAKAHGIKIYPDGILVGISCLYLINLI